MLDLARSFPPESPYICSELNHFPTHNKNAIFYRTFRPEFLLHLREETDIAPLSPDALSGWGNQGKEHHNYNVKLATKYLLTVRIPYLAYILDEFDETVFVHMDLSSVFHKVSHQSSVSDFNTTVWGEYAAYGSCGISIQKRSRSTKNCDRDYCQNFEEYPQTENESNRER